MGFGSWPVAASQSPAEWGWWNCVSILWARCRSQRWNRRCVRCRWCASGKTHGARLSRVLRGATDRHIAVLVDGVPLTLGWDHRTDLSVIPLTAARSIHLLRGLSSVLYGPNVLAGVVSIDVARGVERLDAPPPATLSAALDDNGGLILGGTLARPLESGGGQWLLQGGGGFRDRPGVSIPGSDSGIPGDPVLLSADGNLRLNSDSRHRGCVRLRSVPG